MTRTYPTFGDALADPNSNISRQLVKAEKQTRPIKDEAARLQAEGMTGEQAWLEVLKRVTH